jgi:preprotein translocase subunit SecG
MRETILIIDVLAALGIILLVLLQQGKGADMGSGFGAGASQTLFGSRGSANFLTRATAVLATVFFLSNMTLAYLATQQVKETGSITTIEAPAPAPAESTTTAPPEVKPNQQAGQEPKQEQQKVPSVPK